MRTPPPPSLPPGSEVGGYVIDERIGAGGFGEVFRAHHPVIGSIVAIKILHARYSHDPEAVARFVDEARAVNRITHGGIVQVFDFGRAHDREYFVMELIDGRSLRAILDERGKLPLAEALPILAGIAGAVDAAHAAGIAHRDLKPENVFVLADGRTKLIDFGLAKLTRDAEPVTESGSVFGTPLYMSPEQCRGRGVDTRTDIYSFGALAYHVLTGAPPFTGEPIELALHHVNDPPPPPRVSRTVDRVLLALLAKDPAARPAPLGVAIAALTGARLPIRRRVVIVPLVALALAGATVAVVATRDRTAPVAACAPAGDRIATLAASRAAIDTRFAASPAALRIANAKLDAASASWARQWDAACAVDRDKDPLLYGQRLACLENAFADLRSDIAAVALYEPVNFPDYTFEGLGTGTGGRSLTDCENPAVLRAQVPPPPAAVRERVATHQLEIQRAIIDGFEGLGKRDLPRIDRAAARLDVLAKQLEAIDPPSAGTAILVRLELLAATAWDSDVRRLAGMREARADAARRLEASRDDIRLAQALIAIAWDAILDAHDASGLDAATAAIERARQVIDRAGKPIRAVMALHSMRGDVAIKRGEFDEAVTAFRAALAIARAEDVDTRAIHPSVVMALARGEHHTEARAEAERFRANLAAIYGPDHPSLAGPHKWLSMAAQVAGDLPRALVHERLAAKLFASAHDVAPKREPWGRLYVLDLELQLGQSLGQSTIDPIATLRTIAGLGTTPPRQNPDGIATARRAGLYAAFVYGASHSYLTDTLSHLDHAATLAFHRGDDFIELAKRLEVHCGCTDWIPLSRWLVLVGDPAIDAKLVALEQTYDVSPFALLYSGIVLAHVGRWSEARVKLEAARAAPSWELQSDRADLAAWLGLARMHANDPAGARSALEEALAVISITYDGYDGFSYTTPMAQDALAKLLAESDPARATALAARAKAGFERLRSR